MQPSPCMPGSCSRVTEQASHPDTGTLPAGRYIDLPPSDAEQTQPAIPVDKNMVGCREIII